MKKTATMICGILLMMSITIIVSNVIPEVSADIHSVGPGQTHSTIQEAINAASSGDSVAVYGKQEPYVEMIGISKDITVYGVPNPTPVIQAAGATVVEIDATGIKVNFNSINIDGNNQADIGIFITGDDPNPIDVTIRNCYIYNCKEEGIYIWETSNVHINDSYIYSIDNVGIFIDGSSDNRIYNCDIHNNLYGISINSVDNEIVDCDIYQNVHDGISCWGSSNSFIDDRCTQNEYGIRILNTESCTISASIYGKSNNYDANSNTGIYAEYSTDLKIEGISSNYIQNSGNHNYGIHLDNCDYFEIRYINSDGNNYNGYHNGIYLYDCDDGEMDHVIVNYYTDYGILLQYCDDCQMNNITARGNDIKDLEVDYCTYITFDTLTFDKTHLHYSSYLTFTNLTVYGPKTQEGCSNITGY